MVVVDAPGDRHALVAPPLGGRLPENEAELGAAKRRAPRHLEGQEMGLSSVLIRFKGLLFLGLFSGFSSRSSDPPGLNPGFDSGLKFLLPL